MVIRQDTNLLIAVFFCEASTRVVRTTNRSAKTTETNNIMLVVSDGSVIQPLHLHGTTDMNGIVRS